MNRSVQLAILGYFVGAGFLAGAWATEHPGRLAVYILLVGGYLSAAVWHESLIPWKWLDRHPPGWRL